MSEVKKDLKEQIEYFYAQQKEIIALEQELKNRAAKFNAEMKSVFGVCNGEPINILQIIELIMSVRPVT